MRKISFSIPKIFLSFIPLVMLTSCIKNDNIIEGDAKVKFHNVVQTSGAQSIFFNGVTYGQALAYGNSTEYLVIPIKDKGKGQDYTLISKKNVVNAISGVITLVPIDTLQKNLMVGKNYSVFYRKSTARDSSMYFIEDDLSIAQDSSELAKLQIINLGYSLNAKVNVANVNKKYNRTLGYGEMTEYIYVPIDSNAKVSLNLVNSTIINTIPASSFIKGRTYRILIDGSLTGVLQQRLISN